MRGTALAAVLVGILGTAGHARADVLDDIEKSALAIAQETDDALAMRQATRLTREKPYNVHTFKRQTMMSRLGIDSTPANLRYALKSVLLGEVGYGE